MGLLQELPTAEQVASLLAPVLGDEGAGTGVAGVLRLLERLDAGKLSASLSVELDENFSAGVSASAGAAPAGAVAQFQQAVSAFPAPASLIQPLSSKLEGLKNLSADDLSAQLLTGIDGLRNVETLVPPDARELITAVADRMSQVKGEFISGEFGQIREWSENVQSLRAEIQPLIDGGPGGLEDRLLTFLREKFTDLAKAILPGENLPLLLSGGLDAAISTEHLSAVGALKVDLIGALNSARADFDLGQFGNTARLTAAQASFQKLAGELAAITATLRRLLDQPIASADGLSTALRQQLDHIAQIEFVDLGNVRDKFAGAIRRVEEAVRGLDLGAVRRQVEEVFKQIDGVIQKFDLSQLTTKLADLQARLQTVLDALDGALFEAVASIRAAFTQIKETLRSMASALGSYDAQGNFRFHIQQEIEGFLNGVRQTLQEKIRPMLDRFKESVGQTLRQVRDKLSAVKGEIGQVKTRLQEMLQGVNEQLQSLDVEGTVEATRQRLDEMLGALGTFDFDPVVDPVVAEINEMRDSLKKIDVSSLNEFTIGALKVSVEVVVAIDFSVQITDALMAEFDKLLETPKKALGEIEANVEEVLARFGRLAPEALLQPLDDVFEPVNAHLDALKLESLLKPLDEWYARVRRELDEVSPAALLQPLIELHARLAGALDSVSPEELIRPLREAIGGVKAQVGKIDIGGLATELSGVINQAKAALEKISPESLLDPLVDAFDKVMAALGGFDPAVLLKPFADIFEALAAPLANLTAEHAKVIAEIFAILRGVVDAFDPEHAYGLVRGKAAAVSELLRQLNVGGLLASLKGPYDSMRASFEAHGGAAHVSLQVSVEGLNPLRDPSISQAAADLQGIQTRLQALAVAAPPADLVQRYDTEVRAKLESLIPAWAKGEITPDSVRRAFQLANPLNLSAEINQLYDAVKQQLHNLDPRTLREQVKSSFDKVKAPILSLDAGAIVGRVRGVIDALSRKLDQIDLQLIADELGGLADEVKAIIAGLDPRPIIAQLQGLADEVKGLVAALQPSQVLSELKEPFELSKAIVAEFDPAAFRAPLQAVFENIQKVLEAVDIGVVLQPLADRLEQLRDELEEGLKRTETAFNGMLQAIPV
jgi:hypothetical protein